MSSSCDISDTDDKAKPRTTNPLSKPTTILLRVILPCAFAVIAFTSPLTAALLPFLLLPTMGFWWYYKHALSPGQRTDVETFIWTFILTGTVGLGIVIVIQYSMTYLFVLLLYGSDAPAFIQEFVKQEGELADDEASVITRSAIIRRPQYWIFIVLFCFIVAGTLEELLKYVAILQARKRGRLVCPRNYVALAVAAGLGFGTIENIGFVHAAIHHREGPGKIALVFVERVIGGSLAHAFTAVLTGLSLARRDVQKQPLSVAQAIAPSVFFHGVSNLLLFSISAFDGNVGWIHPRGGISLYMMWAVATMNLVIQGLVVWRRMFGADFTAVTAE